MKLEKSFESSILSHESWEPSIEPIPCSRVDSGIFYGSIKNRLSHFLFIVPSSKGRKSV